MSSRNFQPSRAPSAPIVRTPTTPNYRTESKIWWKSSPTSGASPRALRAPPVSVSCPVWRPIRGPGSPPTHSHCIRTPRPSAEPSRRPRACSPQQSQTHRDQVCSPTAPGRRALSIGLATLTSPPHPGPPHPGLILTPPLLHPAAEYVLVLLPLVLASTPTYFRLLDSTSLLQRRIRRPRPVQVLRVARMGAAYRSASVLPTCRPP